MPSSLVLLAALMGGQPAPPAPPDAPPADQSWAYYGRILPDNARIAAIYTVTPNAQRIVFFSVNRSDDDQDRSFSQHWFALRDRFADGGFQGRSWLDAEECPNLYASLDWLSDIVIPSIHTGVRQLPARVWFTRPAADRPVHGSQHMIEGYGWTPDNDSARVSMSSSAGFLAQWGNSTRNLLDDCWSETIPDAVNSGRHAP